jgi:D-xylose transport system permease protein
VLETETTPVQPAESGTPAPAPRGTALRGLLMSDRMRSLTLVGILAVVAIVFNVLTNGLFLTPRNLTLLSVQVAITAILAAGIVMIMVPAHIDLSVGASVALTGIVTALTMHDLGVSAPVAILLTLLAGVLIGVWHGIWVAVLGVPAFIVTLGSLLGLRGLALLLTKGETIAPGNGITPLALTFVAPLFTVLIFVVLFAALLAFLLRERSARTAAKIDAPLRSTVVMPAAFIGVACIGGAVVATSYRGLPLPVVVLLVVMVTVGLVLRHTRFGRQLYAMGGNPEAARYAGIRTRGHTFKIFVFMGLLYGVGGLLSVARLGSAPPNAANGLELNVIAAAVIGGTSLLGGVGTVSGAVMGALLMESLNNGMSLMNLPSYWQQIAVALVLLSAVFLDVRSRRSRA